MELNSKSNIVSLYNLMKEMVLLTSSVTDDLWKRDIDSFTPEEIRIITELRSIVPDIGNLVMSSDIVTALDEVYDDLSSKGIIINNENGKGR